VIHGKSVVVTGSTSGIGRGIARAFAAEGANVTLNGFGDQDAVEQERRSIEEEFGVTAIYSDANVTKPGEVADMISRSEKTFGAIDVLVNNAGIHFVAKVEDFPVEKWDAVIATNLSSAFHTCRCALPGMKRRGWGRIINIASAHGLVASAEKAAYVAAKHGVVGLTKVVALETADHGITCNAICPGWVMTPLVARQVEARAKRGRAVLRRGQTRVRCGKAADGPLHLLRGHRRTRGLPGQRCGSHHHRRLVFDRRRLDRPIGQTVR
jgi:3-hydroxybutyrate dehydrogenase